MIYSGLADENCLCLSLQIHMRQPTSPKLSPQFTFGKNTHSGASIMVWAYFRNMVMVPYHNANPYRINMFTLIDKKL